jgi:hypothetical protein
MARINRLTCTNRSARTRGSRLAAPVAANRAVIGAVIVLMAATGLAGFTWVTSAAIGGLSPAARSGVPYWLLSLIGAVADMILVLLTAALLLAYVLVRRTPAELHVRRSGGGGRPGGPRRGESGAGQPDGGAGVSGALQLPALPRERGPASLALGCTDLVPVFVCECGHDPQPAAALGEFRNQKITGQRAVIKYAVPGFRA